MLYEVITGFMRAEMAQQLRGLFEDCAARERGDAAQEIVVVAMKEGRNNFV